MSLLVWHVVVGRYPPEDGGVADYSQLLAGALARSGQEVHVWTGGREGASRGPDGEVIHREAGGWGRSDLVRLSALLDAFPGPRRISVQYVSNEFGFKGMNLGFSRWLVGRRKLGDSIQPMFHEVAYPWTLIDKPTRWLVTAVQTRMARNVLASASRAYVSIPAWKRKLRRLETGPRRPISWAPVPSNVPVVESPAAVEAIRRSVGVEGGTVLGGFGSLGPAWLRRRLIEALMGLLAGRPDRSALLVGQGGVSVAEEVLRRAPDLAPRVKATGWLEPTQASFHLQACDLMIQPFPDGISSRRGSAMAGLAHGRPMLTTSGALTEPIWAEAGAVALVPAEDAPAFLRRADALLDDPAARLALGEAALALYDARFAVERTVALMLRDAQASAVGATPR